MSISNPTMVLRMIQAINSIISSYVMLTLTMLFQVVKILESGQEFLKSHGDFKTFNLAQIDRHWIEMML